jgi:hypothetical protein
MFLRNIGVYLPNIQNIPLHKTVNFIVTWIRTSMLTNLILVPLLHPVARALFQLVARLRFCTSARLSALCGTP